LLITKWIKFTQIWSGSKPNLTC